MGLEVYVDGMSQPSRAILIFCKVKRIELNEIKVDLAKRQHLSPEFKQINPLTKVPAIVDGRFKLFERKKSWLRYFQLLSHVSIFRSHAILRYLSCAFPGVADHWYPADLFKRAKIESVLDWHHSNLRRGAAAYVLNTTLAPALGLTMNPQAATEAEKVLSGSLDKIETVWLKGNGRFLLGSFQPSIADLSLVCEIMQLELVAEGDYAQIISPFKKVQKWIEDTKRATSPHFEDVHGVLFRAKAKFQQQRSLRAKNGAEANMKAVLPSKM